MRICQKSQKKTWPKAKEEDAYAWVYVAKFYRSSLYWWLFNSGHQDQFIFIYIYGDKGAHVGIDNENDVTFTIKVDDKAFHLQARNLDEREKWVSKIEESIELHTSSYLIRDNNNVKQQED